ncbi:MAG: phosphodiester glycosidase family protein [Bauldia sp.]|nr:phosphodiester glycosidase family protein [Bauldia sp.]
MRHMTIDRTLLGTFLPIAFLAVSPAAAKAACQRQSFEDSSYIVCDFHLATDDLRTFWRGPDDRPYATFDALADDLAAKDKTLVFAMNGGMYGDDLSPIGLYIEGSRELHPVNTATSTERPAPNFYKKPNGVFLVANGAAMVMTTEDFLKEAPSADFATQSGPMLVIDGALHPAFIPGSDSVKERNGICAPVPDRVTVAITEGGVNFHDFGRFFRDRLGCDNALFLDGGSAPGIYSPELGRDDPPAHGGYGPIIAVVE